MVLPEPVSPTIIITWLSSINFNNSFRYLKIGSDYLTNCIGVFFIYFLAFSFYFFEEFLAELFDDPSL